MAVHPYIRSLLSLVSYPFEKQHPSVESFMDEIEDDMKCEIPSPVLFAISPGHHLHRIQIGLPMSKAPRHLRVCAPHVLQFLHFPAFRNISSMPPSNCCTFGLIIVLLHGPLHKNTTTGS